MRKLTDEKPQAEKFDSTTATIVILLSIICVLANWPFEYTSTAFQNYYSDDMLEINSGSFVFAKYEKISGGFPLTYLIREEDDRLTQPQFWSIPRLALNLVFGLFSILIAGVCSFRYRHFVINQFRVRWKWARVGWSTLVVIVVLTIGARNYFQRQFFKRLAEGGVVITYAIVPRPLVGVVPAFVLSQFASVRSAAFMNASPAIIEEASQLSTVRSLVFYGRLPSSEQVESISRHSQLKSIRLVNGQIDTDLKTSLLKLQGLRELELFGCLGLREGFDGLQKFERLKHLTIVNCDLPLSSIPSDGWAHSIQSMHVSRQQRGADSLELQGLQNLKQLSIARLNGQVNEDLLRIRLHELPALENFSLENLQKLSLDIFAAPRLQAISFVDQDFGFRTSSSRSLYAAPWIESLRLRDLPSLREFSFDAIDLKEFELRGLPNLNLLSMGRNGFLPKSELARDKEACQSRMQSIIDAFGTLDGPRRLNLSALPLAGVDFSPLAKNQRIRELVLYQSGVEGYQLPAIARIPNLSILDLRRCPIEDKDAAFLLKGNLELEQLLVSADHFERIEVTDQNKLTGFVTNNAPLAKHVDIRTSPELTSEILLGNRVEKLHIRDGRSLLGISVDGPLPTDCVLHGFRSLRFFAVGGANATDEVCRHLWQCHDLDHLTIAYGKLSCEALAKIGKLHRLTVLELPGSETDDAIVTENWTNLAALSDVNLSHTKITAPAIDFLLSQRNLQKLSVNYCNLQKTDLKRLTEVKQLIELEIAGIGLPDTILKGCLQRGMLDRLDLSDSQVSEEAVELLCSNAAGSLRFLGLNGCGLNDGQLRRIADAHPKLAMDIGNNLASDKTQAEFESRGQRISRCDREAFRRLINDTESLPIDSESYLDDQTIKGRIDLHQFAAHRQ